MNSLYEKVPLFYELLFDEKDMSISFSLHPEANRYFVELLGLESRMTNYLKSQKDYSPFIFPIGEEWGFGGVFKLNNSKAVEGGWPTWECRLPKKAKHNQLNNISGSIQVLVDFMPVLRSDNKNCGSTDKFQFMMLDGIMAHSEEMMHGGEFSFSYARPVLEFCKKIWIDEKIYNKIMKIMQSVWLHLSGEKNLKSYYKYSFRISESQGDPRLISLSCPGQCA